MSKIKLTKSELKKQRDSHKQFKHYLPTLQLKKQQLQMKILEARREFTARESSLHQKEKSIAHWAGLLAEDGEALTKERMAELKQFAVPRKVTTEIINIAGAPIPYLKDVDFNDVEYDYYEKPFWYDRGIEEFRAYMKVLVEMKVITEQIARLEKELRITTQRVNLFEKVKIPECQENIRRIRIALGDQQANAVGISKVAKKKIEVRELMEV